MNVFVAGASGVLGPTSTPPCTSRRMIASASSASASTSAARRSARAG